MKDRDRSYNKDTTTLIAEVTKAVERATAIGRQHGLLDAAEFLMERAGQRSQTDQGKLALTAAAVGLADRAKRFLVD